jgi:hypothetical protein
LILELLRSLLAIPVVLDTTVASSELESRVGAIARQNQNAKVAPVSSFQWSTILKTMTGQKVALSEALDVYRNHPAVVAYSSGPGDNQDSEAGILLDNQKENTIRNWLEKTGDETFKLVTSYYEKVPWKYLAITEVMLRFYYFWVGSVLPHSQSHEGPTSVVGELTVEVDWSLPLDADAQRHFFQRLFIDYERETAGLEISGRKRYRKNDDELMQLRVLCGLWSQIKSFCASQMPGAMFTKFNDDLMLTSRRDEEIHEIVFLQPRSVGVSHFSSMRDHVVKVKTELNKVAAGEMEQMFFELRDKQFQYFNSQLISDWKMIETVRGALQALDTATHQKKVRWLRELSERGEAALKKHMGQSADVQMLPNLDHMLKVVAAKVSADVDPKLYSMCNLCGGEVDVSATSSLPSKPLLSPFRFGTAPVD